MTFILFGWTHCGFTQNAIKILKDNNLITNNNIFLDSYNTELNEIKKNVININKLNNYRTVPLIFFHNNNQYLFIGGNSDVVDIINEFKKLKQQNKLEDCYNKIKNIENNMIIHNFISYLYNNLN